jgi:hypothetical protein
MNLESEPAPRLRENEWRQRAETLKGHGATPQEVEFLRDRRVELNAMTSRQLVDFIEARFAEYGVEKVIPDDDVIQEHARRIIKHRLTQGAIAKLSAELTEQAKTADLPEDLREQIDVFLEENPELPWDEALARIISGENAP